MCQTLGFEVKKLGTRLGWFPATDRFSVVERLNYFESIRDKKLSSKLYKRVFEITETKKIVAQIFGE